MMNLWQLWWYDRDHCRITLNSGALLGRDRYIWADSKVFGLLHKSWVSPFSSIKSKQVIVVEHQANSSSQSWWARTVCGIVQEVLYQSILLHNSNPTLYLPLALAVNRPTDYQTQTETKRREARGDKWSPGKALTGSILTPKSKLS